MGADATVLEISKALCVGLFAVLEPFCKTFCSFLYIFIYTFIKSS